MNAPIKSWIRIAPLAMSLSVLVGCGTTVAVNDAGNACVKETDQAYCQRLAKNCDVVTGFDNCGGGRSVNCGTCASPATCAGTGTPNLCGSTYVDAGQGDAGTDAGIDVDAGTDAGVDAGCLIACPTAPHWLKGTFTITTNTTVVNGTPYTHAFDGVVNVPISFVASFDITQQMRNANSPSGKQLVLTTSGVDLFFSGDSSGVMASVKANLQNRMPFGFSLQATGSSQSGDFSVGGPNTAAYFTLEIGLVPVGLTLGVDGVPNLSPFTTSSSSLSLRRFSATGVFTDYASGSASIRFDTN